MRIRDWVCTLALAAGMACAQQPPSDLNRVTAGNKAPDFTLPTAEGGKLALSSLQGKNVVLVFYRGYW